MRLVPQLHSASFSNAAQLPTPAVPTISSTAATCAAAGTSTITNYLAANTYTFSPAGPTVGAGGLDQRYGCRNELYSYLW